MTTIVTKGILEFNSFSGLDMDRFAWSNKYMRRWDNEIIVVSQEDVIRAKPDNNDDADYWIDYLTKESMCTNGGIIILRNILHGQLGYYTRRAFG